MEKRCGEVIWNGRRYRSKDRLNTCYMVMQEVNHQLFTETVLDEVLISMEEPDTKQAEEILTRLDLLLFRDRHPMSLSGGQKHRIAIAGILAMKPDCIVLDEPTAMLDPVGRAEVMSTLREMRETFGITLVLITHHKDEAAQALDGAQEEG